ncbi:MAG: hypothetical protein Q8L48_07010 [Archangium sp.]|nr:hypothetical protein [Archangium sp.]
MKMPMRFAWFAGLGVLVAVAAGCRREPANSPEAAYRGFIEALQKGNTRKAWGSLSSATRQKVEERSKAIAEASKGVVRDEPELLLFQGTRPGPLGEVTQVKVDETSALLQVASSSGPREVKLVKDSGKWLIDLSDTLERRDAP